MNREECGEASIILTNFCYFLQKDINKHHRTAKFCEENIRAMIGAKSAGYASYSWQERREMALKDNEVALMLDKIRVDSLMKIEETNYLVSRIRDSAESYVNYGRLKGNGR